MKVTVVGTGNVGAALLFPLASNDAIDRVGVVSRRRETADAAILDVASASHKAATKLAYETTDQLHDSDVVVITSGVTPKGKTADEIYGQNLQIAQSILQAAKLKASAVVICLATPVDYITVDIQRILRLPAQQVIGFGGDLDSNRLRYILNARNMPSQDAVAIGEHGPNAIAVYAGEQDYDEVTAELRQFWKRIVQHAEVVRNLATADLLGKLVDSVVTDSKRVHNVCAFDPQHKIYLTSPWAIGRGGAEKVVSLRLPERALQAVTELVEIRRQRLSSAAPAAV
jgi:malate/lactate dehydrogenase